MADPRINPELTRPAVRGARVRRGFTIIELLVVIGGLAILIGIILVGARAARRSAQSSADRLAVTALKQGVTKFKQDFGFLPPLVKEPDRTGGQGPLQLENNVTTPDVFDTEDVKDLKWLRGEQWPDASIDPRASNASLTFYLIGMLGKIGTDDNTNLIDGKDGPGFREPNRDGTFKKAGRIFEPLFDVSRNTNSLITIDANKGRFELRDSKGVPYRYYRWLKDEAAQKPNQTLKDYLNVPEVVGDPDTEIDLRSAEYAIVASGPNGVFGDEPIAVLKEKLSLPSDSTDAQFRREAQSDNVVEVGR